LSEEEKRMTNPIPKCAKLKPTGERLQLHVTPRLMLKILKGEAFGYPPCSTLLQAMTTIALSPSPLPEKPAPYKAWGAIQRNHLSAYDMILNAEYHANLQVEANPSRKDAKDNVIRQSGWISPP
jgi:hypothetical protein